MNTGAQKKAPWKENTFILYSVNKNKKSGINSKINKISFCLFNHVHKFSTVLVLLSRNFHQCFQINVYLIVRTYFKLQKSEICVGLGLTFLLKGNWKLMFYKQAFKSCTNLKAMEHVCFIKCIYIFYNLKITVWKIPRKNCCVQYLA